MTEKYGYARGVYMKNLKDKEIKIYHRCGTPLVYDDFLGWHCDNCDSEGIY